MKYNLKKKYQIAVRRVYSTNTPAKEILELLGANREEFKTHIDNYILDDMYLNNFGSLWGLDHIVPVDLFDLESEEEKRLCYSHLNIIPMYNNDNRIKGASVHFSLEKLNSLLAKERNENKREIIGKLIAKCEHEIKTRYSKYII